MRKLVIIFSIAIITVSAVNAQYYHDIGVNIGGSNYVGEIGGDEGEARSFLLDMKPKQTKIDGGGFYRYRFGESTGVQLGLNYIRIGGHDSLSTNAGRAGRNLGFRNTIWELAVRGEYYFYSTNDVGGRGRYQLDFKAYLFGGVAGFLHNPQSYYQGDWVSLQPLATEGITYSKLQFAIPVGVGFFYTYKRVHRIGWDFNVRKTFTDYLDDVSGNYIAHPEGSTSGELANRYTGDYTTVDAVQYEQGSIRGNPKKSDWYLTTGLSYSYVMRGKSNFIKKKHPYTYGHKKSKSRTRAKF
jgi:hypothetical protein